MHKESNRMRNYCLKAMGFLTFCPLSRKLKEKILCDLCVEAGGEYKLRNNIGGMQ